MSSSRARLALAVLVGAACTFVPVVSEAVSVGFTGGTAAVDYEGPVQYTNVLNFVGDGTLVSKDQTLLSGLLTATYAQGDPDFFLGGFGFRWTETITNNTGVAWTNYTLVLSPGAF